MVKKASISRKDQSNDAYCTLDKPHEHYSYTKIYIEDQVYYPIIRNAHKEGNPVEIKRTLTIAWG
jgi:hypothetical protein